MLNMTQPHRTSYGLLTIYLLFVIIVVRFNGEANKQWADIEHIHQNFGHDVLEILVSASHSIACFSHGDINSFRYLFFKKC